MTRSIAISKPIPNAKQSDVKHLNCLSNLSSRQGEICKINKLFTGAFPVDRLNCSVASCSRSYHIFITPKPAWRKGFVQTMQNNSIHRDARCKVGNDFCVAPKRRAIKHRRGDKQQAPMVSAPVGGWQSGIWNGVAFRLGWWGSGKRLQVELMAQTTNSTCVLCFPLYANGESCQAAAREEEQQGAGWRRESGCGTRHSAGAGVHFRLFFRDNFSSKSPDKGIMKHMDAHENDLIIFPDLHIFAIKMCHLFPTSSTDEQDKHKHLVYIFVTQFHLPHPLCGILKSFWICKQLCRTVNHKIVGCPSCQLSRQGPSWSRRRHRHRRPSSSPTSTSSETYEFWNENWYKRKCNWNAAIVVVCAVVVDVVADG